MGREGTEGEFGDKLKWSGSVFAALHQHVLWGIEYLYDRITTQKVIAIYINYKSLLLGML